MVGRVWLRQEPSMPKQYYSIPRRQIVPNDYRAFSNLGGPSGSCTPTAVFQIIGSHTIDYIKMPGFPQNLENDGFQLVPLIRNAVDNRSPTRAFNVWHRWCWDQKFRCPMFSNHQTLTILKIHGAILVFESRTSKCRRQIWISSSFDIVL